MILRKYIERFEIYIPVGQAPQGHRGYLADPADLVALPTLPVHVVLVDPKTKVDTI